MAQNPEWLTLTAGFPHEPEHGNLDELTTLPGPRSLLQALFRELRQIDLNDLARHEDMTANAEAGDPEWRHFIVGDTETGFRQTELTSAETSSLPMHVEVETIGLPGLGIRWRYSLDHVGQLGHCAFRHGALLAAFETDDARQTFECIWQQVFGQAASFGKTDTGG